MSNEEIKILLCQGFTRNQIAEKLHLSKSAIDKRFRKLFLKYNAKNSKELIAKITMLHICHEFM